MVDRGEKELWCEADAGAGIGGGGEEEEKLDMVDHAVG